MIDKFEMSRFCSQYFSFPLSVLFDQCFISFFHNPWYVTLAVLTYLLTPWSRVLLEKLTGFQLVKKFPAFYGTLRFITSFTTACRLSLSWASSIQSIPPHSTSLRSILILSFHLRLGLPSGYFPHISPPKPCTQLYV
jgi:hypothetical protein